MIAIPLGTLVGRRQHSCRWSIRQAVRDYQAEALSGRPPSGAERRRAEIPAIGCLSARLSLRKSGADWKLGAVSDRGSAA